MHSCAVSRQYSAWLFKFNEDWYRKQLVVQYRNNWVKASIYTDRLRTVNMYTVRNIHSVRAAHCKYSHIVFFHIPLLLFICHMYTVCGVSTSPPDESTRFTRLIIYNCIFDFCHCIYMRTIFFTVKSHYVNRVCRYFTFFFFLWLV